jgi:hypothetical protein
MQLEVAPVVVGGLLATPFIHSLCLSTRITSSTLSLKNLRELASCN